MRLNAPSSDMPRGSGAAAAAPLVRLAPWLHLVGALIVLVGVGLFTAVHSELGRQVSAGESSAFAWGKRHASGLLGVGLAYLLVVSGLQAMAMRLSRRPVLRGTEVLVGAQGVAAGLLAGALLRGWGGVVPWAHAALQVCILCQVLAAVGRTDGAPWEGAGGRLDPKRGSPALFLACVFFLATLPAALDPSWQRMRHYVEMDSGFELLLARALPVLYSGITGLWFGMATLAVLGGLPGAWRGPADRWPPRDGLACLPFLAIGALYTAVSLVSLSAAIEWELTTLHLRPLVLPVFLLVAGAGGALSWMAFRRLAASAPWAGGRSVIGIVALAMGSLLVLPLAWVLTRPGSGRRAWRLLLGAALAATVGLSYAVVYGGLFDPWFTVLSYVKGALLKAAAVVAGGILLLIVEEFRVGRGRQAAGRRRWVGAAAVGLAGFVPFAALERYPEVKVAILQYHELSMLDATYARGLAGILGLGRWIRLGQDPPANGRLHPWPLPWTLERTGPSRLPEGFNLIVIVVDALRGDAFRSAGYHRDLTPFLDRWAREEALSFRRAYTQGGGTFAAFPFLIGGRSRLTQSGPDLHRENLYFQLALAEGIRRVMVVKDFGPRGIFPSDYPAIELGGPGRPADGRSVSADTVFGWARQAIGALPAGERFLAFLHLMDVHNDLWKKAGGMDFGDTPRDLYDNNLSYLDRALERFVAWLRREGLYHRTVVLLTSDHGEQFWEHGASLHGHTLYEEEIRIPLILLAHGVRGRVEDVPVAAADMAPTLVELAGYSVHPPYDDPHMGISLVPLVLGGERGHYRHRDVVGRASFKRRYFLYRDWEWKLVYSADFDLLQLFNPLRDPQERRNFLREEPALAAELEGELFRYLARVEGKSYRPLLAASRRPR